MEGHCFKVSPEGLERPGIELTTGPGLQAKLLYHLYTTEVSQSIEVYPYICE